ncbi:MAG: response regulator transcription factor, partial [Lachnospiraceae bacterium]|nr:response regulator transcription factor [Lachnospiraceae bacterium]
ELPEEELKGSPVLMAGMCMLYDLLMMPEKAEEWYNTLLLFYQDKTNSRERCREARTWLAYLDIGLPHRGAGKKLEIFKNVFVLTQRGEVVLPELAVTGNLPSIMNGGLDFCEWSKNDYQIAKFMANPLTTLLGKFGNGLITLALAESGFEKKSMPAYEVLTRCNDGFAAAAYGGRIEMCFASVGIQVRQHLVEGQLPSAKRTSESFIRKAWAENAKHLFNNLAAFEIWLSLFTGSDNDLDRFLEAVPDAKSSICILDRYRQMIRLRCLIAKDRLDEAFDLALFLTGYLKAYHRTFLWIENELLKSVILYRKNDPHWTTHLHEAVKKASEYHFVRIISLEGAAILPLLKSIKDDDGFGDIDGEFLTQTYEECFNVAASYPDYLKYTPREEIALTNRETQVLSLLCSGLSMEEICTELKIGYDGLKKHNRNIYKKLGVKNRAEAERKASRLGLTYRGEA